MSVPESKSTQTLTLGSVGSVVVQSGSAHLFVVDESGRRWPLLTVTGPITIIGPSRAEVLVVIESNGSTSMTSVPNDPEPTSLAPFATALIAAYPDTAKAIADGGAPGLSGVVANLASAELSRQQQQQKDLLDGLDHVNSRIDAMTVDRLKSEVASPISAVGSKRDFPSDIPEVNIMRVLGRVAGFTVVDPRKLKVTGMDAITAVARYSELRSRVVSLSPGWTEAATSPLVGFLDVESGGEPIPVALLPGRRGFIYQSVADSTKRKVVEGVTPLGPDAVMVYPSLPTTRAGTMWDLGRLAMRGSWRTVAVIVVCSLAVALMGLATPIFTSAVLGVFVPQGSGFDVATIGIALALLAFSAGAFVIVQNFATSRLTQLGQLRVESALWDRTLKLPLKFFRTYSSGDLAYRIIAIDNLKQLLSSQTVTTILAAIFSLVNFYLLFRYSVPLALAALLVFFITLGFMVWLARKMSVLIRGANRSQQEASAWFVQLVGGISKIRIAGAERRFTDISLLKQADQIANQAAQTILSGRLQAFLALISTFSTMLFFLIIGVTTWENGSTISAPTYIAFSTAFGAVLGAIVGVASAVPAVAAAGPTLDLVRPILDQIQEEDPSAQPLTHLVGRIEFRNVGFRYMEGMPQVLQNLNLIAEAKKITAIVGPSGSGKTTALRLMSALEYPDSGQSLIDGHDIRSIESQSLRKRLGVVVQGGLVSNSSIIDNIGGGAEISEELAWHVADQANIADEIKAMPMKMHTIISPMTLSGGQSQRLLIARALARNPDILLLDEATSALDNVSQSAVTRVLETMKVTQVIIAQRLSTLEAASHVIVMDRGTVAEQGTYDELMAANGLFAALAKRQLTSD